MNRSHANTVFRLDWQRPGRHWEHCIAIYTYTYPTMHCFIVLRAACHAEPNRDLCHCYGAIYREVHVGGTVDEQNN